MFSFFCLVSYLIYSSNQKCFPFFRLVSYLIYSSNQKLFIFFLMDQGAVVVVIVWWLDLQLPVKSVPITTKVG